MAGTPEQPRDIPKELLLKRSPLTRTFLDFTQPTPEKRQAAIRQAESRLRTEQIDPHLGPFWPALAIEPFAQLGERFELFNSRLGLRNVEITSNLWCMGYELENIANLGIVFEDILSALRKESYLGDTGVKDVSDRVRADTQMETFIGEILYHGMDMRRLKASETGSPPTHNPPPDEDGLDIFRDFINNLPENPTGESEE